MDLRVTDNQEKRSIVTGMLLGDAGRTDNNLFIKHCIAQRDYALAKAQALEIITRKKVNIREGIGRLKKSDVYHEYPYIRIEPRICALTKRLVRQFYSTGTKQVTRQILEYLTPQGIAIWFMDDGSSTYKIRNNKVHAIEVVLHTYETESYNQVIIDYFNEVWDIRWGLNKSRGMYRLRMGTREGRRFFRLVNAYILPSMQYKIKTTLESETGGFGSKVKQLTFAAVEDVL